MGLKEYKKKRSPSRTSEPFGGKSCDSEELIFVIQKHAASHLHYDLRLEMRGVLKSWAVPKGPSTDPEVKRLAMMVEDHPYDYKDFEGIIPRGQYGGGTVIVWDKGTYEAAGAEGGSKKEQEKDLLHQLHSGKLKVVLHGKKLKGMFALVKASGRGENAWLLMKLNDRYAAASDITKKDRSVVSKKTLEQVKKTSKNTWNSNRPDRIKKPGAKVKAAIQRPEPEAGELAALLKKGKRAKMPSGIQPMLATLVNSPFDDPGWLYEVKWDGYRTLAYVSRGKAELMSRNKKSFTEKFYPITAIMRQWEMNAVLDSEIMVINEQGKSDFGKLQNWRSEADGDLIMYVFDILWYNSKNLTHLPLMERRAILAAILPTNDDRVRLSEGFHANGREFFAAARKIGLEGIMAKKADSTYSPGRRSKEWLKIKISRRQEVVIGGYTRNEGTSKKFSSLLLGVFENGSFRYAGKVGTGFTVKMQEEMMEAFKPLVIPASPFETEPDVNKPSRFRPNPPKASATWLKPQLVCEVSFTEVTEDGVFRHPSFEGMREDKEAAEVTRERETDTREVLEESSGGNGNKLLKPSGSKAAKTLLNPSEKTQVKKVNRRELKFTNLDKRYWPDDGFTKRDMLNYYYQAAEYILPYLKDRPLSLNRFPNGINGKSFYQKDVKGKSPEWATTYPYTSDGEDKEFLVGDDKATLLWMASMGCIEMNPWFSRIQSPDYPDYCVLDLDPGKKTTFEQVIQAALEVKEVLEVMDVPSFPKTSGSTGMHIYIPLGAKYDYDQSQLFARLIVNTVQQHIPEFTSVERQIRKRRGKMYLDFLQNRPGATLACPYSLRPKPGATVSMPLHWDEVKPGLKISDFTIRNAIARMKTEGDLFKGVLGRGVNLEKALSKMEEDK